MLSYQWVLNKGARVHLPSDDGEDDQADTDEWQCIPLIEEARLDDWADFNVVGVFQNLGKILRHEGEGHFEAVLRALRCHFARFRVQLEIPLEKVRARYAPDTEASNDRCRFIGVDHLGEDELVELLRVVLAQIDDSGVCEKLELLLVCLGFWGQLQIFGACEENEAVELTPSILREKQCDTKTRMQRCRADAATTVDEDICTCRENENAFCQPGEGT